MTLLLPSLDYPYPEAPGYFCICDDCKCREEVAYVDEICTACQLNSHEKEDPISKKHRESKEWVKKIGNRHGANIE